MIVAENICLRRNGNQILDDIKISVPYAKVIAVVGPNGAGKSSLLSILSGAISPDLGTVRLDGIEIQNWAPANLSTRRAVLSQNIQLDFSFNCLEVVLLGRSAQNINASSNAEVKIAEMALEKTDAVHLINRNYSSLSGGESQRVQLARVLGQINCFGNEIDPLNKFLLLDEPISSLDLKHQQKLLSTVRSAAKRGVGVFVILHDLNLACMFADEIYFLKKGAVIEKGTPAQVVSPALVKDVFEVDVCVEPHPIRDCPHITLL